MVSDTIHPGSFSFACVGVSLHKERAQEASILSSYGGDGGESNSARFVHRGLTVAVSTVVFDTFTLDATCLPSSCGVRVGVEIGVNY
jgi:hypothetical protein